MQKFNTIDLDTITFTDYHNKKIVISSPDKKLIKFQIPRLYMPFGLSGFVPEVGQTKWNIDFSMKGYNEDDNYVGKFYKFLKEIENKVINKVHEESKIIFGREKSIDEIRDMFNSNIKENGDREPKFRVKVDTTIDNSIKPYIFDSEKNRLNVVAENGIYSRKSGTAIIEIISVYFLNRKFGITWKLNQLQVFEPQRLKGFQMLVEEEDEGIKGFAFKI